MDDVTKDLTFDQPAHPEQGRNGGDTRWVLDDWTVATVEETMWRIRASGGTDSTPVRFERVYDKREEGARPAGTQARALHVEAFEYDLPPRRPEPLDLRPVEHETAPEGRSPARGGPWERPVKTGLQWAASLALLPVAGIPILYLWSWMLDLFGALFP
jgi:hypothetical protein